MMKYPPDGRRGAVLARGHTRFRGGALPEALAASNRETFLVVQIETREAMERVDDLLSLRGVDAALVGPTDLSVALGVPGQLESPALVQAIEATLAACARHGVVPAIHHNDVRQAAHWAGRGMRMVSVNSEAGYVMRAAAEAVAAVRG
jgi:2-keto-3-deoxy-L-rhamnonate aldolase RhmA